MSVVRVTQPMLVATSLRNLQNGLNKYADLQEQLSTGKRVNRASSRFVPELVGPARSRLVRRLGCRN